MENTVKERLIHYLKYKNIGQNKFEKIAGISNGYISNTKGNIGSNILTKILDVAPDLNKDWLLTGEGEMLNSTEVGVFQRGSPPGYVSLPKEVYEQMLQTIKSQQGVIELLGDVIKKTNARTDTNAECAAAAG